MVTNNNCNEVTAATGKVVQGQGVGTASGFSTATYPSTATGTGTILRADGTNWAATTATFPDTAGTSGNVLTSNGTNWASTTPASGTSLNGYISTDNGDPADSTTYYFTQTQGFTFSTSSSPASNRFYVPVAATLTKVYGVITVGGTLGSATNCTVFVRLNNATNTDVTTTLQLTAASNSFSNTGLSIALAAGDFITFGFTGPAWSTNPTIVRLALGWSAA